MSNLLAFQRKLEAVIGRPTHQRPFVCDGSPLDCRVFIVGFNPASASDEDFWEFWVPNVGFDKKKWFQHYVAERARRPLKPGKTRRNPVSNTRRVINWVCASSGGTRILETNIYSTPSEAATDLEYAKRQTEAFDFLMQEVSPSLVLAHGNDAIAHMRVHYPNCRVIEAKHFSRGWSEQSARNVGADIERLARAF